MPGLWEKRTIKCRDPRVVARVRAVDENAAQDPESSEEMFPLQLTVNVLDDSQLVTLCLESGNHIHFQADTGAQCNVIPVDIYERPTGDVSLSVRSLPQRIVS